jgi:hypothetical protein
MSESFKDMGFKGVRGQGECGPKSIKLMRWGVIGKGAKAEIDTGQDDVRLVEKRGKAEVETENRYRGERYPESVRKSFIEGFLQTLKVFSGVEDREIYEGVYSDRRLPQAEKR